MPFYPVPADNALDFPLSVFTQQPDVNTNFNLTASPIAEYLTVPATITGLTVGLMANSVSASYTMHPVTISGVDTPISVSDSTAITTLIPKGTIPPDPLENLWENILFFLPNWKSPVTISSDYRTSISTSDTGVENRLGIMDTPGRTISFACMAAGKDKVLEMEAQFRRNASSSWLVPLWPEEIQTTQILNSGSTSHPLNQIAPGRVSKGSRLLLLSHSKGYIDSKELLQVADITDLDGIVFVSPPTGTFPVGSKIVPLMEAEINLNQTINVVNAGVYTAKISADEIVGRSSLLASQAANTTYQSDWKVHEGLPIFHAVSNVDSNTEAIVRPGQEATIGLGRQVNFNSPAPLRSTKFGVTVEREDAFKYLRFYDSRMGRLHPFWFVPHVIKMSDAIVNTGTSEITRASSLEQVDWNQISKLALIENNSSRTPYIVDVTSFTRAAGTDTFSFTTTENLTGKTFLGVSWAYKARLNVDHLTETWRSSNVCLMNFEVVEISV